MKHLTLALILLTSPALAYDGEQYVVCKLNPEGENFLALRACASTSCEILQKLTPGTFVITMEPESADNWREVIVQRGIDDWTYSGPNGWVYDRYICEVSY